MRTEILLVLGDITPAYVLLNIAAFVCNRYLRLPFRPRSDFTSGETLKYVFAGLSMIMTRGCFFL